MNKATLYILLTLFGSFGLALKFSQSHEKMPIGCDEFGYLNLAKSISGQGVSEKLYLLQLLDTLRSSSVTEYEIAWMITPHAYHVIPNTNKIINQYPPGTSLILSIFPIQFRQIVFPFICIFMLCLFTIFSQSKSLDKSFNLFDIVFPAFLFLMMVSAPFTTELSRINSLAPTFGLLLAAGMLLSKNPMAAAFMVGLSINFRIANTLMLFPIILFLPFKIFYKSENFKSNFLILIKFGLITFISTLPLFIYNTMEMGNPFSTTYSSIDQAYNSRIGVIDNIKFYFDLDQLWLRIHLIVLVVILILNLIGKLSLKQLLSTASFAILNYLFFILHTVKMDYYPYATAIILLGFIFNIFSTIKLNAKFDSYYKGCFTVWIITLILVGGMRYFKKPHQSFEESKQRYIALCQYDIVWGDLFSGTSEYVCNNSGFRYGITTPRARKIALNFLKSNNYKQAILLDDNTVPEQVILAEIQELGFKYTVENDLNVGKILIIK